MYVFAHKNLYLNVHTYVCKSEYIRVSSKAWKQQSRSTGNKHDINGICMLTYTYMYKTCVRTSHITYIGFNTWTLSLIRRLFVNWLYLRLCITSKILYYQERILFIYI